MNKFKVGDSVRAIRSSGPHKGSYKIGEIYTVKMVFPNSIQTINELTGETNGWSADNFELVLNDTPEELLKKVNDGQTARQQLAKLGTLQQYSSVGKCWVQSSAYIEQQKYRLKLKTEFKKFTTTNGWEVDVKEDTVYIGCTGFSLDCIKGALKALIKEDFSSYAWYSRGDNNAKFFATKNGIKYENHILSWKDAETLLNNINELESK